MRRRFLQGLQERVETVWSDLMDLVDDVDLVFAGRGRKTDVFPQSTDLIDAAIGGAVDLQDVERAGILDLAAGDAFSAGRNGRTFRAVQRFREDARHGGLPHAAGTRKKIGMSGLLERDGVLKG